MNASRYTEDGINDHVVHGTPGLVNSRRGGTKVGFRYSVGAVAPGASVTVRLRMQPTAPSGSTFGPGFDAVLADRRAEADEFYATVIHDDLGSEDAHVARRAYAGLLWGKQLHRYEVEQWLAGDPSEAAPPAARLQPAGRNLHWQHLSLADVISMPDEWEDPWFAAWDTALHTIPLAHVDPAFAKEQLVLMCREWAMNPNGQLPAYEWRFGDVNPPVHAWAAWHVYRIGGYRDREFLIRIFTKLLLNFSWWVNRQDADGSNLFEGGFLGIDNIALFNRSAPLPPGFGWSSPTRPAGWPSTPSRCSRSPWSSPASTRPGMTRRPSSSSTSLDRPRDGLVRHAEHLAVTRAGRLLLRRPGGTRRPGAPSPGPLDGRAATPAGRHRGPAVGGGGVPRRRRAAALAVEASSGPGRSTA